MSAENNGTGVNAGVSGGGTGNGSGAIAKRWIKCGKCSKPGQSRMVSCNECKSSFHYECVRITSEVLDGPWVCNTCLKRSIEASNDVLEIKLQEEQQRMNQYDQQQRRLERQWREENPDLEVQQSGSVEYLKFGDKIVRISRDGDNPWSGYDQLEQEPSGGWMQARLRQLDEYNQSLLNQIDRLQRLNPQHEFPKSCDGNPGTSAVTDTGRIQPERVVTPKLGHVDPPPPKSKSGGSRASIGAALRAQKLKALEEKQALERKQLEEKQALEQELLEAASDIGTEADLDGMGEGANRNQSSDTNFLNITKWLEELKKPDSPPLPRDGGKIGTVSTPQGNRSSHEAARSLSEFFDQNGSLTPISGRNDGLRHESLLTRNQLAARHTVKDLPRFGGDPEDWPRFIAAYERTTRLCGFGNDEILDRLERSLYDRALTTVKGLLLYPENVPTIIKTLKTHFGNPELIVETMVQRVKAMPPPKADRMDSIIDFGVAVQNLCATIKACQMDECLYNVALLQELVERLPPTIKINWAIHRQAKTTVSLADFSAWIEGLVEALSKVTRPSAGSKHLLGRDRRNEHVHVHAEDAQDGTAQNKCFACENECTSLDKCDRFRKMLPHLRWNLIKEKSLCRKCLRKHLKPCDTKVPCGKDGCPFLHHKLLHDDNKHKAVDSVTQEKPKEDCNAHQCCLGSVLFKYAKITLHGNGKSITTYAFLDSGSTCSLMEHSLWKELGLDGEKYPLCIGWTAGQGRYEANSVKCAVDVTGSLGTRRNRLKKVHTVMSLELPSQTMNIEDLSEHYPHLSGLPIESYENIRPRILLGMDNAYLDQPIEAREGEENQPVAALTRLGWLVYGPCSVAEDSLTGQKEFSYHICHCDDMYAEMKQYFMLDSLGLQPSSKQLMSKDDARAIDMLKSNTILEGTRYRTGLLWKFEDVKLPDSRSMALNRLRCLEKKMLREPELALALQAKIEDYEQKGYIRKLTEAEERAHRGRVWYLPIFAVTNPNKPGKLRIVWDAAAEVRGTSLNSLLLKGPDQLTSLVDVLLRFREYRTAVTGDIREMFHQVGIHPDDQHCQRFLWNNGKPGSNPSVYVMKVMTFGASCSPSCAQFVKNTNAERFAKESPVAANAIVNDHYVDDMLSSVETEQEAIELATGVRDIHAQGGFEIRGWRSNSSAVLAALNAQHQDKKNLSESSLFSTEKVLGMWWDSSTDTFTFKLPTKPDKELLDGTRVPTKKEIVRVLMSIFDPLGLLANVLMYLKVLVQEIWRSGIGWNDVVNEDQYEAWLIWLRVIEKVETVSVPRCYRQITSISSKTNVQLHTFVDASKNGCAAVVYLRFEENDRIECAFVAGKTRVAPNKLTSIPRLELDGGTMGVRLAQKVMEGLRIKIHQRFFWTDARDVLCWLNSDHRNYSQFVGFRVTEILEKSDLSEWNYCPSKLNPADDGTKWTKTPDLSSKSRWMHALCFIRQKMSEWPKKLDHVGTTSEELKHSVGVHCVTAQVIAPVIPENFSTWNRLLRYTAHCKRYVRNLKNATIGKPLTTGEFTQEELQAAEAYLHRLAQEAEYIEEIAVLTKAERSEDPNKFQIPKSSPIFKLSPYLDSQGVLRMRGRIRNCELIDHDAAYPVILPKHHHISLLIVRSMHFRYHHLNNETVVNELRQKYRIPQLRRFCFTVRTSCQDCKNRLARPAAPLMGDLPQARLAAFCRPFSFTGVDYFGPMHVAVGRRVEKRWGALFTCLVTRAIHIEIAHSLTTDSCIIALRNFIAIRGTPLELFSDQGTNFIGADRELKEAYKKVDHNQLIKEFTSTTTKWTFNPPSSPHMGGSWERLVQSVKKILCQMKLPRNPTDEVLRNTMLEITNIINSRPLTYVPIESENAPALTPNHLLLGSSSGSKPLVSFDDSSAALRNNWKASQIYANAFWKRWVKEYLPTICRRTKWHRPAKPIQVGDVVVIADPDLPRNSWPMGRVVSINTNKDGQVRSAVVRTSERLYERPAVKLAVLDVGINESKPEANVSTVLRGSVAEPDLISSVSIPETGSPNDPSRNNKLSLRDPNARKRATANSKQDSVSP